MAVLLTGKANLQSRPPDQALVKLITPQDAVRLECLPWYTIGNLLFLAVSEDADAERARRHMARLWSGPIITSHLSRMDLRQVQLEHWADALREDAITRCPDEYACRRLGSPRLRQSYTMILLLCATLALLFPVVAMSLLLGWIIVMNCATIVLRIVSLFSVPMRMTSSASGKLHQTPTVSILLPVYQENSVVSQLLTALAHLDYPKANLDIKLLVEADDDETRAALAGAYLPVEVDVITVPPGLPKTKPRAMNHALPFCRGEIIGIYDAEDMPHPDQISVIVRHLTTAPKDVACVQAALDFYNPGQNWLTRCFTMEYAIWFRVLLHGVQRLKMPLPLGGTSVFFRRDVLEEVGAWDAHNVTEDADLGMRLARMGYRCEMVPSTTFEEANCQYGNWLRQRSRWLKGYAITWLTHMRNPRKLMQDLGLQPFIGFQILLLGGVTSYLAIPLHVAFIAFAITGHVPQSLGDVSSLLWWVFLVSLPVGNAILLVSATLAVLRQGKHSLLPWMLTLPAYWLLGAVAAYRAILELLGNPFHWHKTEHGLSAAPAKHIVPSTAAQASPLPKS